MADASGQVRFASPLREQLLRLVDPAGQQHCHPFRLQRGGLDGLAAMAMRIDPDRIGGLSQASGAARLMVVAAHNGLIASGIVRP